MHIRIQLPENPKLLSVAIDVLRAELAYWSIEQAVAIQDQAYIQGWQGYQVMLERSSDYSLFALTWNPQQRLFRDYKIITNPDL